MKAYDYFGNEIKTGDFLIDVNATKINIESPEKKHDLYNNSTLDIMDIVLMVDPSWIGDENYNRFGEVIDNNHIRIAYIQKVYDLSSGTTTPTIGGDTRITTDYSRGEYYIKLYKSMFKDEREFIYDAYKERMKLFTEKFKTELRKLKLENELLS